MKSLLLSILLIGLHLHMQGQYLTYESPFNQINQTIIQTSDNGFLIAAIEFCYTPNEWVIEGCPTGIHLIRTNETGEVLWTNEIENHDVQGLLHLYENRDGTFTIFTAQDRTFTCHEWIIGPDIGLLQLLTYYISDTGELISQSAFPDDCNLQLLKTVQVSDTTFVLLSRYTEPFASDTTEGRLFLSDQAGNINDTYLFPGENMLKGEIVVDTLNQILVFYVDKDSVLRLSVFDQHLNLVDEKTNELADSMCLVAEDTWSRMSILDNGNLFLMCYHPFGEGQNVSFFVFNTELELLASKKYSIPYAADFAENDDQEILVVSETRTKEDSADIRINYFSVNGDSLTERSFRIPGNQNPTDILHIEGEHLAIAGTHNCCNLDTAIGPGQTFLYLFDQSTSIDVPDENELKAIVFPNPSGDFIRIKFDSPHAVLEGAECIIYSSTGTPIKNMTISLEASIPVYDLPPGVYHLRLHAEQEGSINLRFMKL